MWITCGKVFFLIWVVLTFYKNGVKALLSGVK